MTRFIIEAHVHAQRWSPGFLKRGEPLTYPTLEHAIMADRPWDNARALLQDMDRLGISMAVLNTAFNQRNELILAQIQRYPDRFVGFTGPVDTLRKAYLGKEEFDAEKAAAECDYWLAKPGFGLVAAIEGPPPFDDDTAVPQQHKAVKFVQVALQCLDKAQQAAEAMPCRSGEERGKSMRIVVPPLEGTR